MENYRQAEVVIMVIVVFLLGLGIQIPIALALGSRVNQNIAPSTGTRKIETP